MTRQAVFLDRDGVLNAARNVGGVPRPPQDAAEVQILPGVEEACARLRRGGFLLLVVTNQPDVARGSQTRARVEEINSLLRARLLLDDVLVCYHDDHDDCSCRKPRAGLLLDAAARWEIDLERSFMVGDRWRDIEAGSRAGCRTVLVEGSQEGIEAHPDHAAESLAAATEWILSPASANVGARA